MSIPYRRILMTVDGSFNAEAAAAYAVQLAAACRAEMDVLGVMEGREEERKQEVIAASLARIAERGADSGVEVAIFAEKGDFIRVVQRLAATRRVDMVMAAARHADQRRHFFVATAGSRLMAALSCSVLVVRVVNPGRLARPQRLLVPIRGGDRRFFPEKAYLVARLAHHYQAQVKILQVQTAIKPRAAAAELERAAWQAAGELVEMLQADGITPTVRGLAGKDVGAVILREAAARHHDLIIAGADQRDWQARLLRESPVETLMVRTPCDLMVLRPGV